MNGNWTAAAGATAVLPANSSKQQQQQEAAAARSSSSKKQQQLRGIRWTLQRIETSAMECAMRIPVQVAEAAHQAAAAAGAAAAAAAAATFCVNLCSTGPITETHPAAFLLEPMQKKGCDFQGMG
jgi:CHASE3 domain sensor protein